jgi:hypothetical protein
VLVGIGMIVWFIIAIGGMYEGALDTVDKEVSNALEVSINITNEKERLLKATDLEEVRKKIAADEKVEK